MAKDSSSILMAGVEACEQSNQPDSRLVTVKVLLNAQEHLII